ncbi:MAG TPA: NAD(P)-binding domain-containing protein [Verrucomicrobiae bacterium]|nr:NAD(P)-binding domain-containing protein [Verrucomicrobiae bacterium]
MKIGVLGTGMVGAAIATKLVQLGHHVTMGSRTPNNPAAAKWANENGINASQGTFADAALYSELVFLCTKGEATLEVVRTAGADSFNDKIVIDVSNPLDFSRGMPPSLLMCNTESLGEHVQKALPYAKVVKALNIVNADVMVDPSKGGNPTMLLSGNDANAKKTVTALLRDFGWTDIVDLGDIKTARGTEMLLPAWLSLWNVIGHPHFGFRVVGRLT